MEKNGTLQFDRLLDFVSHVIWGNTTVASPLLSFHLDQRHIQLQRRDLLLAGISDVFQTSLRSMTTFLTVVNRPKPTRRLAMGFLDQNLLSKP